MTRMGRAGLLILLAAVAGCGHSSAGTGADASTDASSTDGSGPVTAFFSIDRVSADFGTVAIGQSADIAFVLTNTGATTSGVPAIATTDPAFTIVSPACSALVSAESCNIVVEFAPTSDGPVAGELVMSGSPGGTVDAALAGTGRGAAMLAIGASPQDFGVACVGSASVTHTFTVTNTGNATSGLISSAVVGADPDSFTIVSSTCASLAPLASCLIDVVFDSPTAGSKSAALEVVASPGGAADAGMLGTAVSGQPLSLSPLVSFPATATFEVSEPQTVTVTHLTACGPTTGPLQTAIEGADSAQFEIVDDRCVGVALPPGAECTISVAFAPTLVGSFAASLTVDGIPGGFGSTALLGTATPAPKSARIDVTAPNGGFTVALGGTAVAP